MPSPPFRATRRSMCEPSNVSGRRWRARCTSVARKRCRTPPSTRANGRVSPAARGQRDRAELLRLRQRTRLRRAGQARRHRPAEPGRPDRCRRWVARDQLGDRGGHSRRRHRPAGIRWAMRDSNPRPPRCERETAVRARWPDTPTAVLTRCFRPCRVGPWWPGRVVCAPGVHLRRSIRAWRRSLRSSSPTTDGA